MRSPTVMSLCLIVCLGSPAYAAEPTAAQKAAAKTKLERGMKLFEEKKYDEAIKELRQGYLISNGPDFLYAIGQVERLRGNCKGALPQYEAYLETDPAPELAAAAKLQIERCEKQLQPAISTVAPVEPPKPVPPVARPEPVVAVAPAPAPAPVPVVTASPPSNVWYRDALGDSLLAGGVVAVGAGAVFFSVGHQAAANAQANLDSYQKAESMAWAQPAGVATMCAGGALIVGAVVRYVVVGKRAPAAGVSFAASRDSGMLVISGRF